MATPLYILDAEITLYRIGADGEPREQVFMGGGMASALTLNSAHKERLLERSGRTTAEARHEESEYTIEFDMVWLQDADSIPTIYRGLQMIMVIIWYDDEAGVWTRRTYYGVTGRSQRLDGSATHKCAFRAESMTSDSGSEDRPSGYTPILGTVVYRKGMQETEIFRYDFSQAEWQPVYEAGVPPVAFVYGEDHDMEIRIDGVTALKLDEGGVRVLELVEAGRLPEADGEARVEFRIGATRMAALTSGGRLYCGFLETDEMPAGLYFQFQNEGWLMGIGQGAAVAPELIEETLS